MINQYSRRWLTSGFLFLMVILSGCATPSSQLLQQRPADLPAQIELTQTPFFPQEDYQCGPAALATSLTFSGIATHPDGLVSQVYLPERKGSLQIEMLATGRRQGALSLRIPGRIDSLLSEVAAGHPVVVLQNLGLSWAPVWHYAVVIGYDLNQSEIILRSGTTERLIMSLTTFERTWARSDYWAMVTLAPGQLPKTADAHATTAALLAFERENRGLPVYQSYQAALVRWPTELTLIMGAGNAAFSMQDYQAALTHFENATRQHPQSAPARNNLALTLAHLGRFSQARQHIEHALSLGEVWRNSLMSTLKTIDAMELKQKGGV